MSDSVNNPVRGAMNVITREEMLDAPALHADYAQHNRCHDRGPGDLAPPYPFPRAKEHRAAVLARYPSRPYEHPSNLPLQLLDLPRGDMTLLDIGGGNGTLARGAWETHGAKVTILDIHPVAHHVDIVADAPPWLRACPGNAYDVVQCTETLEHIPKREGISMLDEFDRVARLAIFITVPFGFAYQPHEHFDNPHQVHVCGWDPDEFAAFGYKVLLNGDRTSPQLVAYKQGWK